jgi:hypothetical protein
MRTGNRVLWILISLILMAAGVVGALISLGHLPGTDRHGMLVTGGDIARWRSWGGWAPAVLVAAGLIVAAVGIALIRVELRRRGGHSLTDVAFSHPRDEQSTDAPPMRGRIQVSGSTLRSALQHDLQNDPRIKHASVRLTGQPLQPLLRLRLEVTPGADLPAIHNYVAAALNRFGTTSELRPLLTETTITGV